MLNVVTVLVCSVLLGGVAYYLISWWLYGFLGSSSGSGGNFESLAWGGVFGLSVAVPFCLIAGLPIFRSK